MGGGVDGRRIRRRRIQKNVLDGNQKEVSREKRKKLHNEYVIVCECVCICWLRKDSRSRNATRRESKCDGDEQQQEPREPRS